ncbi:MFS transporter [Eubacterium aggregans]|uniref:MFS transporter n=1 Tax=Eubacterium aggregans TaxID=81409 RepID=UPI003F41195E
MDERQRGSLKRAIPAILLTFIFIILLQQAFSIISPVLAEDFGLSVAVTSIPVTVCLVLLGVFSVIFGALSDTIALKKLFLFGFCVLGVGSVLGFVLQFSFYGVIVGLVLQTIGQVSFGSLYLVLVSRWMEGREKIKYFALFSGAFQLS